MILGGGSDQAHTADGALARRRVLEGLLAAPLVFAAGTTLSAGRASAATADPRTTATATAVTRAGVTQYRAPFLRPGYRLRLPEGVQVVHGSGAEGPQDWPYVRVGPTEFLDLSLVPEHGAPSQSAYVTGFITGWYEVVDAQGRKRVRVDWDARRFPGLQLRQEWGASRGYPMHGKFFALGLEPVSRGPVR